MSKIKMRCNKCGKWFQSANAKELTCPDCAQKARKEKLAQKNAPATANKPAGNPPAQPVRPATQPSRPKPAQGGTISWLDKLDDVKVSQPEPPAARPKFSPSPGQRDSHGGPRERGPGGASVYDERGERSERGPNRGPGAYRVTNGTSLSPTLGQRPRPIQDGNRRGPGGPAPHRPAGTSHPGGTRGGFKGKPRATKPPSPPKPKREKTPPPEPFVPTPEQITQVEERYLELSQPAEFDGIRTQISRELSIPKKAVKKIIKELRARSNIPSWWEIQTYKGSEEELAKIKETYLPYLPVPPVGVHKKIADELSLKPGTIYQAIKTIRQELKLPQYNDPGLHSPNGHQAQEQNQAVSTAIPASSPTEQEKTPAPVVSTTPEVTSSNDLEKETPPAE